VALSYHFVQVFKGGRLAFSQRPKVSEIPELVSTGCDCLVTILGIRDKPQKIGNGLKSHTPIR